MAFHKKTIKFIKKTSARIGKELVRETGDLPFGVAPNPIAERKAAGKAEREQDKLTREAEATQIQAESEAADLAAIEVRTRLSEKRRRRRFSTLLTNPLESSTRPTLKSLLGQ